MDRAEALQSQCHSSVSAEAASPHRSGAETVPLAARRSPFRTGPARPGGSGIETRPKRGRRLAQSHAHTPLVAAAGYSCGRRLSRYSRAIDIGEDAAGSLPRKLDTNRTLTLGPMNPGFARPHQTAGGARRSGMRLKKARLQRLSIGSRKSSVIFIASLPNILDWNITL